MPGPDRVPGLPSMSTRHPFLTCSPSAVLPGKPTMWGFALGI